MLALGFREHLKIRLSLGGDMFSFYFSTQVLSVQPAPSLQAKCACCTSHSLWHCSSPNCSFIFCALKALSFCFCLLVLSWKYYYKWSGLINKRNLLKVERSKTKVLSDSMPDESCLVTVIKRGREGAKVLSGFSPNHLIISSLRHCLMLSDCWLDFQCGSFEMGNITSCL